MNFESFIRLHPVSRETFDRLLAFTELLEKWQRRINLIAPSTLPHLWERHLLDSLQIASFTEQLTPKGSAFIDLGSGAGFPALPVSLVTGRSVICIESDQRKAIFLNEAARCMGIGDRAVILNSRIETASLPPAPLITARACASLKQLLDWSAPLLSPDGKCLFHKGVLYRKEIEQARQSWAFHVDITPSHYEDGAAILMISDLQRRL